MNTFWDVGKFTAAAKKRRIADSAQLFNVTKTFLAKMLFFKTIFFQEKTIFFLAKNDFFSTKNDFLSAKNDSLENEKRL